MQLLLDYPVGSNAYPNGRIEQYSVGYRDAYLFVGCNIKYTLANCAKSVEFDGQIIGVKIYIERFDDENCHDLNFFYNVRTETGSVIQLDEYDWIKVMR